jgi:hypothetical protein
MQVLLPICPTAESSTLICELKDNKVTCNTDSAGAHLHMHAYFELHLCKA